MPFQSEKQRRYMHANLPDIAKRWERDYSNGGIAELNQELNSLPAYYLPKNQGGRIGYKGGLKVWGKSVDEQWDNLNEDQKKYIRENFPDQVPEEAAQGGLIPAHEAGIYGLEDGGQLVKPGPGRPGYNGQGDYTPDRSTPSNGGGDGRPTMRDVAGPIITPKTVTPTTVERDDGNAREKYISEQYKGPKRDIYKGTDLEEQREIDERNALRKLQQGNISSDERRNLEVGLGFRAAKPKSGFWGTIGNIALAVIPGLLPAKLATTYRVGKLGYDLAYTDKYDAKLKFLGINKNDLLSKAENTIKQNAEKRETDKAELDLINSLS